MPIYHQQGEIPSKRHIIHRQPNGKLYQEELIGTQGFACIFGGPLNVISKLSQIVVSFPNENVGSDFCST